MNIDICICTFRRPSLRKLLSSIDNLDIPPDVFLQVIIVDNDVFPTAKSDVEDMKQKMSLGLRYIHAPSCNISIARNAGLAHCASEWIAFLDDDETVPTQWLREIVARQIETNADAVFGHSCAVYDQTAPTWITKRDYHSQIRKPRNGKILTGHTCNALLRWKGTPWFGQLFDEGLGKTGGEDTEFFFRLARMGAKYAIADTAIVYEPVPKDRLKYSWIRKRRFRIGTTYAKSASITANRQKLFYSSAAKTLFCYALAAGFILDRDRRNFWSLRGIMHLGICAGCCSISSRDLYGK